MWRAMFLATGAYLVILGAECLGVEKIMLNVKGPATAAKEEYLYSSAPPAAKKLTMTPTDWAPWSLISTGSIVMIWSFTIPRRVKGG